MSRSRDRKRRSDRRRRSQALRHEVREARHLIRMLCKARDLDPEAGDAILRSWFPGVPGHVLGIAP